MLNKHFNGIKVFAVATLLSTAIGLAGCNSDDDDDRYQGYQYYSSEVAYRAGAIPTEASQVDVMTYRMPYVTGKTEKATAMVMFPKTERPKDGWRVVVWAHGTTGVGDACAPSKNPIGDNFSLLANSLLKLGYVIVAPDYEGLGEAGIHPYLNLESEAQSAIYAVKAVKEKYSSQLKGTWMSIGQSQGGHASLGIAQFANDDADYRGAVATAPASSLGYIISQIAPQAIADLETGGKREVAIAVYSELLAYAAYTTVGIKAYTPTFDYQSLFENRSGLIAANAEGTTGDNGLCLGDMMTKYQQDIQAYLIENPGQNVTDYPALKADFLSNATVAKFLQDSQPGTQKLNKPVFVVQGKLDMAVPYQVTQALVTGLNALGTSPQVKFELVEDAGHTQAIVQRNDEIVEFIQEILPNS
ncbi:alpha/beta hydrolase [Acinetobacter puyangensis]|uniref:Alpha/beta hydrolase n=1 Tax=Acinetobacter puyangensis TaxID=1096779 RepID=A0A240ECF0_9GAMM|nr:alpha/beta hydrolase [Acinetobacter puyangensis]SNX46226.1 hypothetical protein SAMN05421731_10958 [Acinetobacter puyangensis]